MHRWIAPIAAASLSAGLNAITFAGDLPASAPGYTKAPIALPRSWSGFYLGLNAGGEWGRNDPTLSVSDGAFFGTAGPPFITAAGSRSFNNSGVTAGAQVGYNWQWNTMVMGLESDFGYFQPKGSIATSGSFPAATTFALTENSSADWLFTFRPRVGVAINNWLLYGTGGVAISNLKFNEAFGGSSAGGASSQAISLSQTKAGWAAGGGVEYGMTRNWSLRGEYLHLQFDGISGASALCAPAPACTSVPSHIFNQQSGSFREDVVRGGINYKLD